MAKTRNRDRGERDSKFPVSMYFANGLGSALLILNDRDLQLFFSFFIVERAMFPASRGLSKFNDR